MGQVQYQQQPGNAANRCQHGSPKRRTARAEAIALGAACMMSVFTLTAHATPPAGETQPPTTTPEVAPPEQSSAEQSSKQSTRTRAQAATRPGADAVELSIKEGKLTYTYDLSDVFDDAMWQVLEENGYSEVTVEVRLRDSRNQVRGTQFHQLKIELLESGRVRVMTSPRRGRIYKDRKAVVQALQRVDGKPMAAADFADETGHLELVVLVNPVQVYSFPDDGAAPVANQKVVPQTYYDRKLELRSGPTTVRE